MLGCGSHRVVNIRKLLASKYLMKRIRYVNELRRERPEVKPGDICFASIAATMYMTLKVTESLVRPRNNSSAESLDF